jgi:di/tricarboxylate transporter
VSQDAIIVFVTLGVTIALFVSDRLRLDVVALMSLLALLLSGVISVEQGLAGFSSPLVLMIAGLFVIGSGLARTGVAEWLGLRLASVAGNHEARVIAVVMIASALLSAFMSSTGTVAILLPVVVSMAERARLSPARLLMPLAFASLLGGTLTLIGTPPNLVVSNQLREGGLGGFGFFSFTPAGLALLAVGISFMVLIGRKLLPGPKPSDEPESLPPSLVLRHMAKEYDLPAHQHRLRIAAGSPLVGQTLAQAALRSRFGVTVIGIQRLAPARGEEHRPPVIPAVEFRTGDLLALQGETADSHRLAVELGLEELPDDGQFLLAPDESLAEVVVPRRSRLVGRSLREIKFRDRYRATVLSVRRAGRSGSHAGDLPRVRDLPLEHGDTLLLKGRTRYLRNLREEHRDLVMVTEPRAGGKLEIAGTKALLAVAITLGMLLLMTFGVVPHVVAVLLAAVAMVTLGCLSAVDAYRGINWESVVLIAAILPMATALEKTGGMRLVVDALVGSLGGKGPYLVLAALFLLTSAFSQVISNTATAVLVAPVAFKVAVDLGFAPHAFLMTVAIAASTAFATPIASPVNTLVLNPGGYRFGDFFKLGLTLQLALLAVTLLLVPLLFPL